MSCHTPVNVSNPNTGGHLQQACCYVSKLQRFQVRAFVTAEQHGYLSPQRLSLCWAAKLAVSPLNTPNSIHCPEQVGAKGLASENIYWMVRHGRWCCSSALLISRTKLSKSVDCGISGVPCTSMETIVVDRSALGQECGWGRGRKLKQAIHVVICNPIGVCMSQIGYEQTSCLYCAAPASHSSLRIERALGLPKRLCCSAHY